MFTSRGVEACVLADFHFLLADGAHDKGGHEHDSSRWDNFEIRDIDLQILVIKIGQAETKSTVQTSSLCALLDPGDDFPYLIDGQCASLIDQLPQHAITFLGIFIICRDIGSECNCQE